MIDRQRKIAYKFFESNENYFIEELQKNFKQKKYYLKENIVNFFDGLFGKINTLELFLEWIISEKKITLTEDTIFVYRDIDWLQKKRTNDENFSWTQEISEGSIEKKTYTWIYRDGKLVKMDDNEVSQ